MKKKRKRVTRTLLSFMLAVMLAFQGTSPIFVMAKDAIENAPRDVDFSRPEALTAEEAGTDTSETPPEDNGNTSGQGESAAPVQENPSEQAPAPEAPVEEPTPTEEPAPATEEPLPEETPAEVELFIVK